MLLPFIIEKHIKSITKNYLFQINLASLTSVVSRQDDSSELALITRPVVVPVLLPDDVDIVSPLGVIRTI